jgi:uncharacterized PurR-regulated membrane protein YhhQ (DUF165 family)
MTDNAQHADLKRMWSGWISLVLFVLLIPLSNWVIVNLGVVCPPGEPCLVPVLPGLWAPSTVLLAGFSLVLRDVVHHCLGWRWALASIFFGAVLSGFISEPSLVVASVSAFLFAELADFAVYAPMKKRYPAMAVIVSGLVGSAVDSAISCHLPLVQSNICLGRCSASFGSICWPVSPLLGGDAANRLKWRFAPDLFDLEGKIDVFLSGRLCYNLAPLSKTSAPDCSAGGGHKETICPISVSWAT